MGLNNLLFAQFNAQDKRPGAFGQVQYGVGGQSAANRPVALLLIGLMASAGTLTPNTQIQQIFQSSDADTYAVAGSELACQAYDAIATAPTVPTFIASPGLPGGATAASNVLTIGGTWTAGGTIILRVGGQAIPVNVGSTDTVTTVGANVASILSGYNLGRLPVSASASSGKVTLTSKTPSVRGNQHVVFVDTSAAPAGLTATFGVVWATGQTVTTSSYTVPTVANGFYYKVTTAGSGTTGVSQPTWPTTVGTATSADGNGVVWTCWGILETVGAATGTSLGGGTGLETYTSLLSTLQPLQFGRIAIAANDATSAAAIQAQIDSQALISTGFLQHVVVATNGLASGSASGSAQATALAQTTLNDQRFQCLFYQNCETHPSRIAAAMAAYRANAEATDPDAAYDGLVLSTVATQAVPADWATVALQVSLLNNSVTPLVTIGTQTQVVRSITTHSLLSANPDYSTLDTGMAVVPDFVLTQLRITYTQPGGFKANNPRVRGPLISPEAIPPGGVAYPDLWNSTINGQLLAMQAGTFPPGVPPILYNVDNNPPTTAWDVVNKRMLSAVPVFPMPTDHQVLISVQQNS